MSDFDVQKEWEKLVEVYAGMSDEELSSLAEQGYELTELARQVLQAEIKARGLNIELVVTPPGESEAEENQPRGDLDPAELELTPFLRVWEASRARDVLKALHDAGIPAYLGPENVETVEEFRGDFEAGCDIRVRPADQRRASAALAAAYPKTGDDATEEPIYLPHCPNCQSEEVVFEELVAAASATDSAISQKFRWRCDNCGHEWEDDGLEE